MTWTTRGALAALLISAAVVCAALAASPAEAATIGPGYDYRGDAHSHLGGYLDPDGTVSYCIDAGKVSPAGGATSDQGIVGQVNGLPPQTMLQLAYILAAHGNTTDNDTAAAMALVVWGIADPADHAARGGDGFVITRAPAAHRPAILSLAAEFRSEAAAYVPPAAPAAELSLSVSAGDPAHAELDVQVTPQIPWSLTLTNGVFADTGLATREGVADESRFDVNASVPAGPASFVLAVDGAATSQTPPDGSVHLYTTPGAQSLAASAALAPLALNAHAEVEVTVPPPPAPPAPRTLPRVAG